MELSSGFFISPVDAKAADFSAFEPISGKGDGCCRLFKGNIGGQYRVFKALKPEFRGNPVYEDLLKKEYEIGRQLDHPNIRKYFGYHAFGELGRCIEMEWVDGEPLDSCDSLDRKTVKKILCELCDALSYVHGRQIIHRDVKPSNVLVTHNGRNVKLIDFGFSDADWFALLKTPAGTLSYASPEQVAGDSLDCRSDIYSLGVMISELLPWRRGVARKCMREDREARYASAAEVKDALCRRRMWPLALILAVLIVAAVLWFGRARGLFDAPAPATVDEALYPMEADSDSLSVEDIFEEATRLILDANGD